MEDLPKINIKKDRIPVLRSVIGEIDYRLSQGANEHIQISALLAEIIDNIKV